MLHKISTIKFRMRKARTKLHLYMCLYIFRLYLGGEKPGIINHKPTKSSYSSDAEGNREAEMRTATKLMCYIFKRSN